MGQYPSPYSPPQYPTGPGYQPVPPELLAPARRASTLMFVIAGLCVLLGLCIGGAVVAISKDQLKIMISAQHIEESGVHPPPGMAIEDFVRIALMVYTVGGLLIGAVLAVLGIFVRRASKVACFISAIGCGLIALFMGLGVLNDIRMGVTGNAMAFGGACVGSIPLVLFSLVTVWILKSLKLLPQIEAARQQWQAYYAASQQQQQAYGQAQYGYGYPPAPPPGYPQPPAGGPPVGGAPSIGYGAIPPVAPGEQSGPPVRHPPLPPDQQNPPQ